MGWTPFAKLPEKNYVRGASDQIMATGGLSSPTDPVWMLQYSDEEIRAAVEEAASRRTYVMAHAYTAEAIARVVKLGVRSIEHANLIDQPTAELVAQRGAYVVPTLVTYETLGEMGKELGLPANNIAKLKEIQTAGLTSIELCKAAGIKLGSEPICWASYTPSNAASS